MGGGGSTVRAVPHGRGRAADGAGGRAGPWRTGQGHWEWTIWAPSSAYCFLLIHILLGMAGG